MSQSRNVPRIPKWVLRLQVFLLRRQWMGSGNRQLMVITTTGRKSGQPYSVPVGFARDGRDILAFSVGGASNWYKNVLANGRATLDIEGKTLPVRAEPADNPDALYDALMVFKRERPGWFPRFFGTSADAPTDELMRIGERVQFMRFYLDGARD